MICLRRVLAVFVLCATQAISMAAQSAPSAQAPSNPILSSRPLEPLRGAVMPKGQLQLDLTVTDGSGNPVTDLQPWDLKLTDNGKPSKILSFRGFDGKTVLPDPPVEVIVVIDELNVSSDLMGFMRDQAIHFLRQNGGRPVLPVSVMLLTDKGLRIQPQPSLDGNGMAEVVRRIPISAKVITGRMGAQGAFELDEISLHNLLGVAINEGSRPGRKILLWMGAGWPLMNSNLLMYTDQQRRELFTSIVALANGLRQAQITVYGLLPEYSGGINESTAFAYRSFLNPVVSAKQVMPGNLGLGVLAEQSGGGMVGPSNDLVAEMNSCLAHASAYYRISFNPPAGARADEYHALHIVVDRPGLAVHADAGYYEEPEQTPMQN